MIPGGNLLATALSVITPSDFVYKKFLSRTKNDIGILVPTFEDGVDLSGSTQPVSRSSYKELGLDFNKRYIQIWVTTDVSDVARGKAADRVEFNGREYEVSGEVDWFPIDGWNSFVAADIGAV